MRLEAGEGDVFQATMPTRLGFKFGRSSAPAEQ